MGLGYANETRMIKLSGHVHAMNLPQMGVGYCAAQHSVEG